MNISVQLTWLCQLLLLTSVIGEPVPDNEVLNHVLNLEKEVTRLKDQMTIDRLQMEENLKETIDAIQTKNNAMFKKLNQENQQLRGTLKELESGNTVRHNSSVVSFTAFATESRSYAGEVKPVIFDGILDNTGGQYFPETSTFLCVTPGLYLFSVTVRGADESDMDAEIMMGDQSVGAVMAYRFSYDSSSNTVVVQCPANTEVYVRSYGSEENGLYGDTTNLLSTFTGVLLFPTA